MCKTQFKACLLIIFSYLFCYAAIAQKKAKFNYEDASVFAGIEVGSKGVKLSVVDVDKNAKSGGAFTILKDTAVNTDFISFSNASSAATLDALNNLYTVATRDLKIPSRRVFTVVSSGVKMQAEKDSKKDMIVELVGSFRQKIKEPDRQVEVVDVIQEARLSHLGIVPESKRYTTFLIDIGSGNTKGGYFPNGNTRDFKLFQLNWGTKSTANATEKRCEETDKTLTNFNRQLYRVLTGAENTEIIYAVNSSGAYPLSDNIAFSGGIAWAAAMLVHPEQYNRPVVTVTFDEILKFSEQLYKDHASLSGEALAKKITDPKLVKADITKEIKRVHAVFDQRSLMAGAGLLLKIMRQFASIYETKQFYLVKSGQVGWISAYVDQQDKNL
ncbi:MAG TPA: hypothetical protein VFX58_09540 [Chitinophagaceae bacterium]|nr:hypothetical protein [Chitinophagaceae bacterium]